MNYLKTTRTNMRTLKQVMKNRSKYLSDPADDFTSEQDKTREEFVKAAFELSICEKHDRFCKSGRVVEVRKSDDQK